MTAMYMDWQGHTARPRPTAYHYWRLALIPVKAAFLFHSQVKCLWMSQTITVQSKGLITVTAAPWLLSHQTIHILD